MSGGRPPLPEGPYLIVGLARSGAAAARMLSEHGQLIGYDRGEPEPPPGIETQLGGDGVELLERVATVVKSPGVPREAPVIAAALERGIPVVGELELAWRLLPNRFLAVTGTNGKTTSAELLGAIYREAGLPVAVAGNVGTPLSALVGELEPEATIVCELSSFQLEDAHEFAPETALLLNLELDHLDRHGSVDAYREAKLRVFAHQGQADIAVLPAGFELAELESQRISFGGPGADLALVGNELRWRGEPLLDADELRLRGAHNVENAMGAAAAALASGVAADPVRAALRSFAGVPHRLEEVALINGVLYVNDSKATNVASALRGLEAFPSGVHAILGGSLKGGGFEGLRGAVAARCKAVYLIGEAADRLESDLAGAAPLERHAGLPDAVHAAAAAAEPGEVVLLSPAAASYDQFRDFEERGERFRELVTGRA